MMHVQLVGHTPVLEVTHIPNMEGALARVVAIMESLNPGGSGKDRIIGLQCHNSMYRCSYHTFGTPEKIKHYKSCKL